MDRRRSRVAIFGAATLALALGAQTVVAAHPPTLLEFGSMVGLPSTLTGAQSAGPLRGIAGGGLPWTLASGRGELSASGHLEIKVSGLVLAAGALAGSNPIASFRGLVSCVQADGTFSNVLTDPFPATTGPAASGGGNAEIEADVSLPSPCLAPIVFVTSPGGAWFAVDGE
jgi:hypothetical protein